MKKRIAAGVVACSMALSGCQVDQNVEKGSAGLGAVLGGVLGNQVCKDKSNGIKVACTAAGALVGYITAEALYKKLTAADRKRMDDETARALAEDNAHSAPREWNNPQTGVTASVVVKEETVQKTIAPVPILKGPVTTPPPLKLIGKQYEVTANTLKVRGGPGTDYKEFGESLKKGETVDILAAVEAHPDWLLLARDGVGSGYVSAPNLRATGKAINAKPASTTVATNSVSVQVEQSCKTIEQTAKYRDGSSDKATSRMCQQGDGSWRIVS